MQSMYPLENLYKSLVQNCQVIACNGQYCIIPLSCMGPAIAVKATDCQAVLFLGIEAMPKSYLGMATCPGVPVLQLAKDPFS